MERRRHRLKGGGNDRVRDTLEEKKGKLYVGEGKKVRKENIIMLFLSTVEVKPKTAPG